VDWLCEDMTVSKTNCVLEDLGERYGQQSTHGEGVELYCRVGTPGRCCRAWAEHLVTTAVC
jgi:hypothetical protein